MYLVVPSCCVSASLLAWTRAKVVGGASSLVAQRGPGYRLPASSGFQPLADDAQVTPEAVDEAVDAANNMEEGGLLPFGTVFAGHVGDPLLEMDTLVRICSNHVIVVRSG